MPDLTRRPNPDRICRRNTPVGRLALRFPSALVPESTVQVTTVSRKKRRILVF